MLGTLLADAVASEPVPGRDAQTERTSQMLNSKRLVGRRPFRGHAVAAEPGLALGTAATLPPRAQETSKLGSLHSPSGTMAISETTLKDVMLMLIEEQNAKGGLLGRKLEAVVVDPAS